MNLCFTGKQTKIYAFDISMKNLLYFRYPGGNSTSTLRVRFSHHPGQYLQKQSFYREAAESVINFRLAVKFPEQIFKVRVFQIKTALNLFGLNVVLFEPLRFKFNMENLKRSEEHTSELQSHSDLVCRLLLEKKNRQTIGSSESW